MQRYVAAAAWRLLAFIDAVRVMPPRIHRWGESDRLARRRHVRVGHESFCGASVFATFEHHARDTESFGRKCR